MSTGQFTSPGTLARLGFTDARRTATLLATPELSGIVDADSDENTLLRAMGETADPALTLIVVVRLLEAAAGAGVADDLRALLHQPGERRDRLLGVLGASTALGDHLVAHPSQWPAAADAEDLPTQERVRRLISAVSPAQRGDRSAYDALRVAYREQMLGIVALDVAASDPIQVMPGTAAALADLAGAALSAALVIAEEEHPEAAGQARLAVMAMGKCGGRELNYVSDVDVIFAAEPRDGVAEEEAMAAATQLASTLMRACSASTGEGTLWPVDPALRPEGKQGQLVRTVASHRQYYQRWAKTWEFQALLKARPVAGDPEVGQAYLDAVQPMIWEAAGRENFVEDVQAMRRRVEQHVPAAEAKRQLKLGPGGLRDIEFSVQLLQLVHGRSDESLRSRRTLDALDALAAGGYVGRAEAAELDRAYRLLRSLEHRIQMYRMRRTHLMPTQPAELRRLGRSMGHRAEPDKEVVAQWQGQAREVRRIHERLFYRPLLAAAAKLSRDEARLAPKAAEERLKALGFRDPAGAMRHLEALTSGYSRTAAMQRTMLPIMLGWFADEADPDAGLLAFRKVSESLGSTPWYMKMLRDEGDAAERLARVLSASWYAADLLERAPEAVRIFASPDRLLPRRRARILATTRSAVRRKESETEAFTAARVIRRHELFRTAVADLSGVTDLDQVGVALTDINECLLEAALYLSMTGLAAERGAQLPIDLAVIGMGRLGGRECSYSSDADVLFVHRAHAGTTDADASAAATEVIQRMMKLMGTHGPDPQLALDLDLRPEGKSGPLVRSLDAYRAYYQRWSMSWETQALVRARPVAGHVELGAAYIALIDPLRWHADGLSASAVKEMRRLKARMEAERLPRGADRKTHTKLGRGGLTDVEWTIQSIQLRHAHEVPELRVTSTMPALEAARTAGLIAADDAAVLRDAWVLASRLRNAITLWRGRPSDSVPSQLRDADGVYRIIGGEPGQGGQLAEHYLRSARRARAVTERLFYGH